MPILPAACSHTIMHVVILCSAVCPWCSRPGNFKEAAAGDFCTECQVRSMGGTPWCHRLHCMCLSSTALPDLSASRCHRCPAGEQVHGPPRRDRLRLVPQGLRDAGHRKHRVHALRRGLLQQGHGHRKWREASLHRSPCRHLRQCHCCILHRALVRVGQGCWPLLRCTEPSPQACSPPRTHPSHCCTHPSLPWLPCRSPLGTFNAKTAQDSCDPCAPGQYANTLGSKACKTCSAGTFSLGKASACSACKPGFYSLAGSGVCSPCKPGYYANLERSGTCKLCPKGYQCATPAVSTPKPCPAGTYSAKDGATVCTPCPVNYYIGAPAANGPGATACKPCDPNTNTRGLTGQSQCQAVRITTRRRSML